MPTNRMLPPYNVVSPLGNRYYDAETASYLAPEALLRLMLACEVALTDTVAEFGLCDLSIAEEIRRAVTDITAAEVADVEEAEAGGHDIRAVILCIQKRVGPEAKAKVHWNATSFDIRGTGEALLYRVAQKELIEPRLVKLMAALLRLAYREASTPQIGRTHLVHALPTTFGRQLAWFASRLGSSILKLRSLARELPGKFSGMIGGNHSASLFFDDPEDFERRMLAKLGLEPAECSTQIPPPEPTIRFLTELTIASGIMANLADNFRILQMTEVDEVLEPGTSTSSAAPHKRNPQLSERVKSIWKIVVSRLILPFLDQISLFERDLTNSASARTYPETPAYVCYQARKLTEILEGLTVHRDNMLRNMMISLGYIASEPLQQILREHGHPSAHEVVQALALRARDEGISLESLVRADPALQRYLEQFSKKELEILADPSHYRGNSVEKTIQLCEHWATEFGIELE